MGISSIDPITIGGVSLGEPLHVLGLTLAPVTLNYYLFLFIVVIAVVVWSRRNASRLGRAWMAIREDEIAAKAMGLNVRNLKLLAFGLGATFCGVAGVAAGPG